MEAVRQASLLQRYTSQQVFLGQMALERRQGTPATTAGTCSWELGSLSLYVAGHRQWCSASFAHGVLATWGSLLWYYRTSLCGHTFL